MENTEIRHTVVNETNERIITVELKLKNIEKAIFDNHQEFYRTVYGGYSLNYKINRNYKIIVKLLFWNLIITLLLLFIINTTL